LLVANFTPSTFDALFMVRQLAENAAIIGEKPPEVGQSHPNDFNRAKQSCLKVQFAIFWL